MPAYSSSYASLLEEYVSVRLLFDGFHDLFYLQQNLLDPHAVLKELTCCSRRTNFQRIYQPQLNGVHFQSLSQFIHLTFMGNLYLGTSISPHCPTNGIIRIDDKPIDFDIGYLIGSRGLNNRSCQDTLPHHHVGTRITYYPDLNRYEFSLLRGSGLVLYYIRVSLGRRQNRFFPCIYHLSRPTCFKS